jgi:hypothetical protein
MTSSEGAWSECAKCLKEAMRKRADWEICATWGRSRGFRQVEVQVRVHSSSVLFLSLERDAQGWRTGSVDATERGHTTSVLAFLRGEWKSRVEVRLPIFGNSIHRAALSSGCWREHCENIAEEQEKLA